MPAKFIMLVMLITRRLPHHDVPRCREFLRVCVFLEFPDDARPLHRIPHAIQHHVIRIPRLTGKHELRRKPPRLSRPRHGEMEMPCSPRVQARLDGPEPPSAIAGGLKFPVSLEMRIPLSVLHSPRVDVASQRVRLPQLYQRAFDGRAVFIQHPPAHVGHDAHGWRYVIGDVDEVIVLVERQMVGIVRSFRDAWRQHQRLGEGARRPKARRAQHERAQQPAAIHSYMEASWSIHGFRKDETTPL